MPSPEGPSRDGPPGLKPSYGWRFPGRKRDLVVLPTDVVDSVA